MSDYNNNDIVPVLDKLFGAQADAQKTRVLAALPGRVDITIWPEDVKPAVITNSERDVFEGFMVPYRELLELFQPEACRDSDYIGFNLAFMQRLPGGRLLSPFEVLRGKGVEIVARSADAPKSTRPDSHSVVLSVPAQPDMLARVTDVLAKYGIVPENMTTSRYGDEGMNVVIEIAGETVTREAAEKFVAALQQKLLMDTTDMPRLFTRPGSKRLGPADHYPVTL